jgi:hypothetical protein
VRLNAKSKLSDVAVAVGDALRREGISAVLTGGACASLYTGGAYHCVDVDFVLSGQPASKLIDGALESLGFRRRGDRYIHPKVRFYVEFPRGALGIGQDFRIRPVMMRRGSARTLALSATDSCPDRLAAFYHWNDRQSLGVATSIALRNRVNLRVIRAWSDNEGHLGQYRAFVSALRDARQARRYRAARRVRPTR